MNLKSILNKEVEKLTALVSDIFVGYEDEGAFEQVVAKQLMRWNRGSVFRKEIQMIDLWDMVVALTEKGL